MSEEYELIAHLIAATEAGDVDWTEYPTLWMEAEVRGYRVKACPDGIIYVGGNRLTVCTESLFRTARAYTEAKEAKHKQAVLRDLLTSFRADKVNANPPPVPNYP